jgi:starvation-inducible DNA-binding protein
MFTSLHALFDEQYTELAGAVDEIAERMRALGVRAPGSYAEFSKLTSIKEAIGTISATDMTRQLVDAHETLIRSMRDVFPLAADNGDEATVDLLTGRLHVHEKTAWMLRSLLEG